jgi:soluble lytic murein transglycosylase
MRVVSFPTSFSRPVRRLTGFLSLCLLLQMTATPLSAKTSKASDDSGEQKQSSADSATGKSKAKKAKPGKKAEPDKKAKSDKKAEPDPSPDKAKSAPKAKAKSKKAASKADRARTAQIKKAFVASSELRPMAQQLATMRTPAAYAGVSNYAHKHTGEAAAAAYLALGHAYLLDKRYTEAAASLREARKNGVVLADFADFLSARAYHEGENQSAAEAALRDFSTRYPESIFSAQAPELEANTLLAMGDPAGAQRVLAAAADTPAANRPGFQLAQGQVAFALGQSQQAIGIYKRLLLGHPLSAEAETARAKLTAMGAESSLTIAELRSLGDAYYNGGHYSDASAQYRALARQSSLDEAARNSFAVAAAACDLKLKRLSKAEAEALADSNDESGARRLYLLMELARNRDDLSSQQSLVKEMESRFPQSSWLAEALYSSGNLYLLRRDYPQAVEYYSYLAIHFPESKNASPAHWRAGWLCYRQGLNDSAALLFDEQIRLYPNSKETAAALYWRGRLYETVDHNPGQAAAYYRALNRVYQHFFYAQLARQRLADLGNTPVVADPQLDRLQPAPVPVLEESFPEDSLHMAKARLLANAGLNDYIAQELKADPDSASWSSLAEAQIYASYGENFRAMRALKRALPAAATAPIKSVPLAYWRILFPEPYWETIQAEAAKNHLDPYLVASLIRQESEFNPSAVSKANAYGLMQMLPSVGKSMAREEGMGQFKNFQLLDPETNIRLGTRYLRKTLDKFGGVPEYALAAYNAGDSRVEDWQSAGPYRGIDEFVESIPFTETREYVQAILRNQETYRAIDAFEVTKGKAATK